MEWFSPSETAAVREFSLTMDRSGHVHQDVLQLMYDKRLLKLFVPERYNGRLTALPEALRIFERASWIDGSFGWLVTIGSGGGYFVPSFPPALSEAVFSDRKAVIAGSGAPSGQAVRTQGGYRLSGTWKYCSGAPFATTFTAAAYVDGGPSVLAFALEPNQVEIIPDWHAFGLRATGSHSITAKDAFIPDERTFQVGNALYDAHPIYRYPFAAFAVTSFTAVSLGIGTHFLEESSRLLEESRSRWDLANPKRSVFVAERIEQGRRRLKEQAERFYEAVEFSWAQHLEGMLTEETIRYVSDEGKKTASVALSAAQALFPHLGMAAVMEDQPINRLWRDLLTACQHASLKQ